VSWASIHSNAGDKVTVRAPGSDTVVVHVGECVLALHDDVARALHLELGLALGREQADRLAERDRSTDPDPRVRP